MADTPTVLVIRDPDESNEFVVDGEVKIIDVDLGRGYASRKELTARLAAGDYDAGEFIDALRQDLAGVPSDSPVHRALAALIEDLITED